MATLTFIKLETSDKVVFSVSKKVAEQFLTIKDMLEDLQDLNDHPIPLPNISSTEFKHIVDYFTYRIDHPLPAEEEKEGDKDNQTKLATDMDPYDKTFTEKFDSSQLIQLILATNYLNCKSLMDSFCKRVALSLKGKTPEEIRKLYNLQDDFTPEEKAQIAKENEWCEER